MNPVLAQHFTYPPDDPKFSSDLSFMTEEDWKKYDKEHGVKKVCPTCDGKRVCPHCKGHKFVTEKIKNLGTLDYRDSFEPCPTCRAKGYLTEEDDIIRRHNEGIGPCPHCKGVTASSLDDQRAREDALRFERVQSPAGQAVMEHFEREKKDYTELFVEETVPEGYRVLWRGRDAHEAMEFLQNCPSSNRLELWSKAWADSDKGFTPMAFRENGSQQVKVSTTFRMLNLD